MEYILISRAQQTSDNLNIITGFHLFDDEQHLFVLEGRKEDAIDILTSLSGHEHKVITGVVIVHGDNIISFADTTNVLFHTLTPAQIAFYVDKYKPYDKAGAYAIQEWIGVVGIKKVEGDFYNVMGLPVSRVVQALDSLKRDN